MKKMWYKKLISFLVLCFIMALLGGSFALHDLSQAESLQKEAPQVGKASETDEETLVTLAMEMLSHQEQVESEIETEFEQGEYTFQDPLVVLNPYGISPLTAIVMFRTEEPCEISVLIPGGKSIDDVSFTFEGYEVEHRIPVYGLFAGQVNHVYFTAKNYSGGGYN